MVKGADLAGRAQVRREGEGKKGGSDEKDDLGEQELVNCQGTVEVLMTKSPICAAKVGGVPDIAVICSWAKATRFYVGHPKAKDQVHNSWRQDTQQ